MAAPTDWPTALDTSGPARDAAIAALRDLLLRAARFELGRRSGQLWHLVAQDLEDLAEQSADDALVAVLAKLETYRGRSRFTTWAYKFALLEAGVNARRRAWSDRELPLTDDGWQQLASTATSPATTAGTRELLDAIRDAIATDLTPHQRDVLVALALNDVPIDVLAERLDTTRGTLCEACFEHLDAYVEAEHAGADADADVPGMAAHLEGCPACREDYESLRAMLDA